MLLQLPVDILPGAVSIIYFFYYLFSKMNDFPGPDAGVLICFHS